MSQDNPSALRIGIPQLLAGALAIALTAWLNVPALHPFHLEAYSMSLLAMGIDLLHGGEAAMYARDPDMTLVTQYIYLTRPLCAWALAGAARIAGPEGAWPLLMVSGWILTMVGCVATARQRGVVGGWAAWAVLLCQGVTSAGSSWNETLMWAGLCAVAAAAVPAKWNRALQWRYALAGVLVAAATMSRQDGLLGGVVVGGLVAASTVSPRQFVSAGALALAGFTVGITGACMAMGVDLRIALDVARLFTGLREEAGAVFYPSMILFSLGFPLISLVPFGMAADWKTRGGATLMATAFLIWMASVWIASNPRYLLPVLFPLFALWGGQGLRRLALLMTAGRYPVTGLMVAMLLVMTAIVPPVLRNDADGPNVLLGRAVEVHSWLAWQDGMRRGEEAMRSLVSTAGPGTTAVITAHYDDDAALRLQAAARGWQTLPSWRDCPWATAYTDGHGKEILHVRTVAFYGVAGRARPVDALMAMPVMRCSAIADVEEAAITSTGASPHYSDPSMWGDVLSAWMLADPVMRTRNLSKDEFHAVGNMVSTIASEARAKDGSPLKLPELMRAYERLQ